MNKDPLQVALPTYWVGCAKDGDPSRELGRCVPGTLKMGTRRRSALGVSIVSSGGSSFVD